VEPVATRVRMEERTERREYAGLVQRHALDPLAIEAPDQSADRVGQHLTQLLVGGDVRCPFGRDGDPGPRWLVLLDAGVNHELYADAGRLLVRPVSEQAEPGQQLMLRIRAES